MHAKQNNVATGAIAYLLAILNAIILREALVSDPRWYRLAWITVPLLVLSLVLMRRNISDK
jgi:hypothetical protein